MKTLESVLHRQIRTCFNRTVPDSPVEHAALFAFYSLVEQECSADVVLIRLHNRVRWASNRDRRSDAEGYAAFLRIVLADYYETEEQVEAWYTARK